MAGKRITMETARNVFRTLVHTGSIHKTSRVLGISRNTIRKQLKLLDSAGVSIEEASLLDYTQLNELLNPIKESVPTEKWLAMEQMLPGLLKDLGHKHEYFGLLVIPSVAFVKHFGHHVLTVWG